MISFTTFINEQHICIPGGMNISRTSMPQLDTDAFVKYLEDNSIGVYRNTDIFGAKPLQVNIDTAKVDEIASKGAANISPIVVSSDGYVLDGHHRFFASKAIGCAVDGYVVDLPINKLLKLALEYNNG